MTQTIYDHTLTSIDGVQTPLSTYRDKVLLIVNVASECGFTRQYAGLQALHQKYAERGLVVLGVPSNDFGGQEPGSNDEIKAFCTSRFDVTFPMFDKVHVRGGNAHPLYAQLQAQAGDVEWNFNKFLVDRSGHVVERYESGVEPDSAELVGAIETALGG